MSTQWLFDYPVYDEEGRLAYRITPKAYATLGGSLPYTISNTIINSLCYKYEYDLRGRMILQKEPGIEPVYLVYDQWDRIALTQNGKQKVNDLWSFTKYDEQNRVILTGIIEDDTEVATIRSNYAVYSERYEVRSDVGGNVFGYTNVTHPISPDKVFYVCYHDDYSFLGTQITGSEYLYDDNALAGLPSDYSVTQALGRKTGTKTLLFDDSETTYLNDVTYFEENGDPLQVINDNHKGGIERASNLYDFVGLLTKSQLEHFDGDVGKERIITSEFEYDHGGRLRKAWHQLDGANKVLLSELKYNELGQVVREEIHKDGNGALQATDYNFTIQGSLKGVNISGGLGGDADDYFTQELAFNDNLGSGNTTRLDGFVTGNRWKNDISDNSQAYNYTYDAVRRLSSAEYKKNVGLGWTANVDAYSESGITYDQNGNIQTLRRQTKGEGGNVIDDLSYTYGSNSNRLLSVADAASDPLDGQGFVDGNTSGDDYDYDATGNLIQDLNKGISSITYNSLNLPQIVTLADGTIKYVYDAFWNQVVARV